MSTSQLGGAFCYTAQLSFRCSFNRLHQESEGALQVFSFTKVEWLDVLDFSVTPNEAGGSMIEAHSWSSGMVPCSVPGAPALNAVSGREHLYHYVLQTTTRISLLLVFWALFILFFLLVLVPVFLLSSLLFCFSFFSRHSFVSPLSFFWSFSLLSSTFFLLVAFFFFCFIYFLISFPVLSLASLSLFSLTHSPLYFRCIRPLTSIPM